MSHKNVNEQSSRPNGGSAFSGRLRSIRHPVPKLLLLPAMLLVVVLMRYRQLDCLWLELLGIPCPGCGMTRALSAFMHGQMVTAFRYHFMFPSLPVLYLYLLFDGRPFSGRWLNRLVLAAILAGFLLHWVVLLCQTF